MEQFGIIEALEAAALAKGWKFDFAIDNRNQDFNIGVCQEFQAGDVILLAATRQTPTRVGALISEINYDCLLMLGRKFDPDGIASSLDETSKQKYDRRLSLLAKELSEFIAVFMCDNELEGTIGTVSFQKNMFDTNIDFAVTSNATFIQ